MHTENRITIDAPVRHVYRLAAQVEHWPRFLSHYRYVHVLAAHIGGDDRTRLVKMGATRSGIPVNWTAIQQLDPRKQEIRYRHVAGVTRGMDVRWTLEAEQRGTRVSILHDLDSPRWWLRRRLPSYVVATAFVEAIADRTLLGVKLQAEHSR